ncbi:MAG: class I SAM-dependent methyltransferase [Bacillota bacterium]
MAAYRATTHVPPLVREAMDVAKEAGFEQSCTEEVGRLLRLLASQFETGTIGEIGTGYGVGAAWIASALAPGACFVTVEIDEARAARAHALFRHLPNVRVIHGDWREIVRYGPFTMLFADGARVKERHPEVILQSLKPGGLLVLDDLTPEDQWPTEWRGRPDPVRQFWLNDPRVTATEVMVSRDHAVILATRSATPRRGA